METTTTTVPRVRMNASQTAKGLFQVEATGEAATVEEARNLFARGLAAVKEEVHMAGHKLVSDV